MSAGIDIDDLLGFGSMPASTTTQSNGGGIPNQSPLGDIDFGYNKQSAGAPVNSFGGADSSNNNNNNAFFN